MGFLDEVIDPPGVGGRSVSEVLRDMADTGFQGRRLGESVDAWTRMLQEDDLTVFMGLSGAMVPAGMRRVISYLVRQHYVDCIVSTGANMFHDLYEAQGGNHYRGHHLVDDERLYQHGVDRIYDVFASEEEFREVDHFIADFAEGLEDRSYSSREFMRLLGQRATKLGWERDSVVVSAYLEDVPIFVPAIGDSSIGIGLTIARRRGGGVTVDQIADVDEITWMVEQSTRTGVIYVGGGVPKNFIQQTEVISSILDTGAGGGHDYAIQYTTDAPHWGGLSGCTFDEGISWGKISAEARKVQVFVDATIALPLVAEALHERMKGQRRSTPKFTW